MEEHAVLVVVSMHDMPEIEPTKPRNLQSFNNSDAINADISYLSRRTAAVICEVESTSSCDSKLHWSALYYPFLLLAGDLAPQRI